MRILCGYADLKENCGIVILYEPIRKQWNYVEKQLAKKVDIVGSIELNFEKNYVAFENLLHDIYNAYSKDEKNSINRKIELLKLTNLNVRVILVEGENIDAICKTFKWEMRDLLNFDIDKMTYLSIHATDSRNEFNHLKNIVFSVNNLNYLYQRLKLSYRREFFTRLEEYKALCSKYQIPLEDTCIVGSSVLEALGIRMANDLDFVISNNYFESVSSSEDCKENKVQSGAVELLAYNYVVNENNVCVLNDYWIHDERYYFIVAGCKFLNIEYIYLKKKLADNEKSVSDKRLIELYMNYSRYCDSRTQFEEKVKQEMKLYRRER